MPNRIDLSQKQYGRLTVRRFDQERKRWLCECTCGGEVFVRADHLKDGHVQSCGCLSAEKTKERFTAHGQSGSRLHRIWVGMKQRCTNTNRASYENYGGRGIRVCDEWANDFAAFLDWAAKTGYKDDLSIDRIDFDGNYCPENCRWATMYDQQRNKANNRIVSTEDGEVVLSDYCKKQGLPYHMVLKRVLRGWDTQKAIETPPLKGRKREGDAS